jgi:hypothetical protein
MGRNFGEGWMSFQIRSTIAMTVKTPRTAVGIVRTVVVSVVTCGVRKGSRETNHQCDPFVGCHTKDRRTGLSL